MRGGSVTPISISLAEISTAGTAHGTAPQRPAAGPAFSPGCTQGSADSLSNSEAARGAQTALSPAARAPNAPARPAARDTESLYSVFLSFTFKPSSVPHATGSPSQGGTQRRRLTRPARPRSRSRPPPRHRLTPTALRARNGCNRRSRARPRERRARCRARAGGAAAVPLATAPVGGVGRCRACPRLSWRRRRHLPDPLLLAGALVN